MTENIVIRRALISVSDKTGIAEFAGQLVELGVEIISTGGTARLLNEHQLPVTEVSDYTGFPEMMEGRLKTLHPRIHGGLLGRRGIDDAVMSAHDIPAIDLVIVNLYPFEQTVAQANTTLSTAIENIDIGGPTMVRAAAKNHAAVAVVVDTDDYPQVAARLQQDQGALDAATRFRLAVKAFEHTARYDGAIANYLGTIGPDGARERFPAALSLQFRRTQAMRYGENPHQQAAFYVEEPAPPASMASLSQLQGKALSYNNVADTDAALQCVRQFEQPACVIVKHANPCGVAVAGSALDAYQRAYATDPTSAFGGIIAFNTTLDADTANAIVAQQFAEVLIAPQIESQAMQVLAAKKNLRVLRCLGWSAPAEFGGYDFKRVSGGLLVQERDRCVERRRDLKVVSKRHPDDAQWADLEFAWRVAMFVKSNAIVYARAMATIGIGAGQMSRVYSARIAGIKAADEGLQVAGAAMASDAFFPFRDSIDAAAEAGICAVIQPGGSVRDEEVIAAADQHDLAMVFTGIRHFRH